MTFDLESAARGAEEPEAAPPAQSQPEPPSARADEVPPEHLVPAWLAVFVLVLLFALIGVGGFVARGLISEPRYTTPEQREIEIRLAEVAADRENPRTRLALAYAYQQAGRFDEALTEYDSVLELIPNDTAALFNKGVILFETGEEARAEEALQEVLKINPGHVLAAKVLGEHFSERKDYRSVISAVRPAAQTNESSADLQYLMGLAHENLGETVIAEEYYRMALKYYPDMTEAREGIERLGVEP